MSERLDLIAGKPVYEKDEQIATFTRFTLPFAYQLEISEKNNSNGLYYQTVDKNALGFIKRKKYFTRETADTLYGRGQWLTMCDDWDQTTWGKAEVQVSLRGRDFKIGMLPPMIVLFELPEIKPQKQPSIMQTGFLYVDVYFCQEQRQQPQLDDLLVLNEYFRYFGMPYDFHAERFKNVFFHVPERPDSNQTIASLCKLRRYFERWAALLEIPFKHDDKYYRLFPKDWANNARKWMYNLAMDKSAEHWQIYADNRCYVWTVAFLKQGGKSLRSAFEPDVTHLKSMDYGHWIKLLNVDCPPFDSGSYVPPSITHKSLSKFERQWADQRTYKRWEESGSWYGYCYHAAAILAPPEHRIFEPSGGYYYDTSLLLFYIRMTLYRFSRELSKTMPEPEQELDRAAMDKLRGLRRLFSHFTIQYRFPMLSNQQQSMEMYEINRAAFEIDQFFDEIQQEVDNTHEFMEMLESQRLATAANQLATIGIPLAAGGLLTAIFSMSNVNIWQCFTTKIACTVNSDLIAQFVGVIMVVVGTWLWMKFKRR